MQLHIAIAKLQLIAIPIDCSPTIDEVNTGFMKRYEVDGKRIVRKMPLEVFIDRLVENFDIRFKRNDIEWPKHIKISP